MNDKIKNSEKSIDYSVLKQINEHALKYDSAPDKKEFLKNVSAYEQKLILLNSIRPYDVLNYLNELDLESSRLVLSELNKFEIKKIIDLFTTEDKRGFYNNFSDLDLVNQFIKSDQNSIEFVEDLTLDRKIELIDSSKIENKQATEEIYKTMSNEEKNIASTKITNLEASIVLNSVDNSVNTNIMESNFESDKINKQIDTVDLENETDQLIEENNLVNEEILEDINEFKDEFLKTNLQFLKENYKEFENINVEKYNLLPEELKMILDKQMEETNKKEEYEQKENDNIIKDEEEIDEEQNEVNSEDNMSVEEYDKYSIIGNNDSKISIVSNPKKVEEFNQIAELVEVNQLEEIKNKNDFKEGDIKSL